MALNLYANIGEAYTGIVTGPELTRITEEILGGAQLKVPERVSEEVQPKTVQQTQIQETSQPQINLYSRNTDIGLTQQVAQMKAGFNIQISPQAIQNIEALKTMAATQQMSVHKLNEGKIYVPVDNSPKSDTENVFALSNPTNIVRTFSMEKDRKGSNPFSYTNLSSQNQEESAEPNGTI